ncbi:MAG TPA: ABC transporter ATP-binding protein [Hyphomicrobiales bacterium]|nr:ABC transporter ATP-binding protein [Hyphomicrobiales bacterium]
MLLEVADLAVHFGGVKAVDGVSFAVEAGEVFSIIGPNGAGKTTIFNLISRIYDPSAGRIAFKGEDITALPAHLAAQRGIGRTFQNVELFAGGSVLKNLLLGCEVHRRTSFVEDMLFLPRVRRQELAFRARVEEVIELLDLGRYRHAMVGGLPYGLRKVVELGRALAMQPDLLLLDEPSSGLNSRDTEIMADWIQEIRRRRPVTMIVVEHDMNLVAAVSDRVLALEAGRVLAQGTAAAVQADPQVIRAYLGE